ncbi:MAG: hypothetical protein MAG715_00136 [Methanonatronarchaeales archaeon]|nr:hypothetical protein [Methanonatronarchaeales archaeon]
MDFAQTVDETGGLSEEVSESREKTLDLCTCPGCPTHLDGDWLVGYCFPTIGSSESISNEAGCICGNCPVYLENDLEHGYYCTRGSELEQSG